MNDDLDLPVDRIRQAYPEPTAADVEQAWQRVITLAPFTAPGMRWMRATLAAALLLSAGFGAGWVTARRVIPPPPVVTLMDGSTLPVRAPELVAASGLSEEL